MITDYRLSSYGKHGGERDRDREQVTVPIMINKKQINQ